MEWCFQFIFGSNTFYFFSSKNKYVILGLPVRIKKNIIFTKFSDVYLVFIICRCLTILQWKPNRSYINIMPVLCTKRLDRYSENFDILEVWPDGLGSSIDEIGVFNLCA